MDTDDTSKLASYFGLSVKVIHRLDEYSLICFDDRYFIVATEDLDFKQDCEIAA